MTKHPNPDSGIEQRIDALYASESDRRVAKEHLRDGEFVAGLVYRAGMSLRSTLRRVGSSLAHRTRRGSPTT